MLESIQNEELEYQRLSKEEQEKRGILGRLVGVCADFINPTRNGRRYSEELWEKVFKDPIMVERINNGVCYGELGHPEDREETDMEKIAVCLSEVPKKGKDGKLRAVFDILSTPNGRILKSLCDYGSTLGVSSRGSGDTFTDFDGQESVDPDTYNCTAFDIVLVPAVKEARLKYVTESLEKKRYNKTLKQTLTESVNKASEDDRKVMLETLKDLDIDLTNSRNSVENKSKPKKIAASDSGANLVEDLQNVLVEKKQLEDKITELQEKLSVCYAKEADFEDNITSLKKVIGNLTESSKSVTPLKNRVAVLEEQLQEMTAKANKQKDIIQSLRERNLSSLSNKKSLNEDILEKDTRIKDLSIKVKKLTEQLNDTKVSYDNDKSILNENIAELKKDSEIKHKEYSEKLEKANSLVERYKKTAKIAVNKYIESKATMIGISTSDIKSRLSDNYSFNDIDRICEDLQTYKVNISKLPFNVNKNIKLRGNESMIDTLVPMNQDDVIDDSLLSLVNNK